MNMWGIRFLIVMLGLLMSANMANAEEENVEMDTVVVTATRNDQKVNRVPANISVIDQEDIKNSNGKSVADLLRSEAGVHVRDLSGTGKSAQVDLRGFGETGAYNTLVMVDGRRVNEMDLSGTDWSQIPLEQIERIEVLRGTGTVLYGDNATGGVINIITKMPSEGFDFSAGTLFGSYSRNKEQISVSGGQGKIGASLHASYESTNGYRENSEFRAKNIGGKIVFDPSEYLRFNLSGSYHTDSFGLPGDLFEAEMKDDRRSSEDDGNGGLSRDRYISLASDVSLGDYGSIVADIAYRARNSHEEFVMSNFLSSREADTYSFTPRYTSEHDILGHENIFIAGVDLYWAEQDADSYYLGSISSISAIERDSMGYYFNNEFSILKNLFLSVGARREAVEYDMKQQDFSGLNDLDDSTTERESAYTAGLTFQYADNSSVFVRANRSVRFPLTDELIVYDFIAGAIKLNGAIKPQSGKHYEVGVRHSFTPNIQANLTIFHAKVQDEIFFDASNFVNTNHPQTVHQGVEFGARAELWEKLTLFGNYTYEKAEFDKAPFKDNDIPSIPDNKLNMGLRVQDIVEGLMFSADYHYVGSMYAISDQDNAYGKVNHYYTIDTRLSYEWKMLTAYVGMSNITNQEYSEYAAVGGFPPDIGYYPAPERNWVAGIKGTF